MHWDDPEGWDGEGGGRRVQGGEAPLEEGMATCSSILAWRIPRTEEPGGK